MPAEDLTPAVPDAAAAAAIRTLIAIDGGGTGTRVRVTDAEGRVRGEATAGPASLTLGVEQAWASIGEAIDRAGVDRHRTGGAVAVAAALAGSRNRENRARFHALNPLGVPVVVMTDGHASLIGALAGRPGTVAAVGTGVAVHRLHPDGRVSSCSGWGFPAGDEGSGAWIGQRAIAWHLRHLDGRDGRESLLGPVLAGRVGSQAGEIQAWLLGAPSTRYASLAPLVIDAAAGGDAVAGGILDAAAAEISCGIDALDRPEPAARVALTGGLGPVLAERLPPGLRRRLVAPEGGALDGLILILRGLAPGEGET